MPAAPYFASFRTDRGPGRSRVRAAHRMTALVLAASVLALRAASVAAGAPSFDCTKARTPDEKAICADPALSALDAQLGVIYRRTMQRSNPGEAAALRATQLRWIQDRSRDCSADRACLQASLSARLGQLDSVPVEAVPAEAPDHRLEAARPSSHSNASLDLHELRSARPAQATPDPPGLAQLQQRIGDLFAVKAGHFTYVDPYHTLAASDEGAQAASPQRYFNQVMQSAYGTNADYQGYDYKDVGTAAFADASQCLAQANALSTPINNLVEYHAATARSQAGDTSMAATAAAAKQQLADWLRAFDKTCAPFAQSTLRPEIAHAAVLRLLDDLNRFASDSAAAATGQFNEYAAGEARQREAARVAEENRRAREAADTRAHIAQMDEERRLQAQADTARQLERAKQEADPAFQAQQARKKEESCKSLREQFNKAPFITQDMRLMYALEGCH